jgi:iron complex transport system permease protein
MAAVTLLAAAASLSLGAARIPLADVIRFAAGRGGALPAVSLTILREVRLPRTLMGLAVGALLGTAGALLQGFLRNPLAEPYLLGVSSGAAAAVTVVIVLGLPLYVAGLYVLPLAAFAGALLALLAVYFLARGGGRLGATALILAGVVVSAFLAAVVMLLASFQPYRYAEVMGWLMGHLQPVARGTEWWTLAWAAGGLLAGIAESRDLNALLLGEAEAEALGVGVEAAKLRLFVVASLLTGVAVASSGLIGFVGLIAPHAGRLLLGPDHRTLVPASALAGAALLVTSDVAARLVVAPGELPAGVVTALLGGPFFLWLLARQARADAGRGRRA